NDLDDLAMRPANIGSVNEQRSIIGIDAVIGLEAMLLINLESAQNFVAKQDDDVVISLMNRRVSCDCQKLGDTGKLIIRSRDDTDAMGLIRLDRSDAGVLG